MTTGLYMTKRENVMYRKYRTAGMASLLVAVVVGGFGTSAFAGMGFRFTAPLWLALGLVVVLLLVALAAFYRATPVRDSR